MIERSKSKTFPVKRLECSWSCSTSLKNPLQFSSMPPRKHKIKMEPSTERREAGPDEVVRFVEEMLESRAPHQLTYLDVKRRCLDVFTEGSFNEQKTGIQALLKQRGRWPFRSFDWVDLARPAHDNAWVFVEQTPAPSSANNGFEGALCLRVSQMCARRPRTRTPSRSLGQSNHVRRLISHFKVLRFAGIKK